MRLTEPLDIAPVDQRAPELEERLVGVVPLLIANLQPLVAIELRERPFNYPLVAPQPFAGFDVLPDDVRGYAPRTTAVLLERRLLEK